MLKYSYKILNTILILVFVFLLRNESPKLVTVANYASFITLILGISILILWRNSKQKNTLNNEIALVYRFWLLMLGWFFIVPIIFFNANFSVSLFYQGMYHDYRYLLFATLPFVFVSDSAKIYYDKIFRNVGYVALVVGCIAVVIADKSISAVSERTDVFSLPYYFYWIVLMVFPYLFLIYYFNRKFKIGVYLIVLHFILSFIFLKRAGFLNGTLVILMAFLFSKDSSKAVIFLLVVLSLIFFSSLFFNDYIDLLMNRFVKDGQNLEEWDRIAEVEQFFNTVSPFQLVTGFGANNYFKMNYIGLEDNPMNSMHIGAYNILYKGGYFYAGFMLFLTFKIISLYRYINFNIEIKIGFILGIIFIMSLTYEQSWSYFPAIFFTLLPIYRAIYLKAKIKLQRKSFRRSKFLEWYSNFR